MLSALPWKNQHIYCVRAGLLALLVTTAVFGVAWSLRARAYAMPEGGEHSDLQRVTIDGHGINGLSGLVALKGNGFLAVPERQELLARLTVHEQSVTMDDLPLQIVGIPSGLDHESVAILENGLIAIGTESRMPGRMTDEIYFLRLKGELASVVSSVAVDYSLWGVTPLGNQGVEALAVCGGTLLAGLETVMMVGNERYAPLGLLDLKSGSWRAMRLKLTTDTGKLSSLSCRVQEDGTFEVFGIERHFGVGRVLRFQLDPANTDPAITPSVAVDLADYLCDLPNFEGLLHLPDGRFLLLTDNQGSRLYGPTEAIFIKAAATSSPASKKASLSH